MKHVQAITLLLFLAIMGLSGCDQAKDLATEAAEKAKKDIVSEISKAVNGGDQNKKEDGQSSKETKKEEDEKK
ncbi:MAG: hypothetical protein Q8O74_00875 [bacterium]|nr:hypothetical protein [bacterium]